MKPQQQQSDIVYNVGAPVQEPDLPPGVTYKYYLWADTHASDWGYRIRYWRPGAPMTNNSGYVIYNPTIYMNVQDTLVLIGMVFLQLIDGI